MPDTPELTSTLKRARRSKIENNFEIISGTNLIKDYKLRGKWATRCRKDGKDHVTQAWSLYAGILGRCDGRGNRESYAECKCSFESFQEFAEWCQYQQGYGLSGYHLDKDILVKGNNTYSSELCVFVPYEINSALVKPKVVKKELPVGVVRKGEYFIARVSKYNSPVYLGFFKSIEEAFSAYKSAKEAYLKELAGKYKDVVDCRVYEKLMNFNIDVNY